MTAKGWSLSAYRQRFKELFPERWAQIDDQSVAAASALFPGVHGNPDWAHHDNAQGWLLHRDLQLDESSGFTKWWEDSGDPRSMDAAIRAVAEA